MSIREGFGHSTQQRIQLPSKISKRESCTLVSAAASISAFAGIYFAFGFSTAIRFALLLAFIPVFVYLQMKEKQFGCSPEVLLNEAPAVIGMMSVTLSSNGSFDSAIRYLADNGPKNFAAFFKKIVVASDCRSVSDIKSALMDEISRFPKELSSFRRAMHIAVTAFESPDQKERVAMMKDAENIVLEGLRTMGNTYSSKLSTPCMTIFGLGIMVPMILISVLPMLSMGGQFAVAGIDSKVCEFAILVAIPAIVGLVILSMRGKNPFFEMKSGAEDLKYLLPMLSAIPVYLALQSKGMDQNMCILISAVASSILSFTFMVPAITSERKRVKTEEMLKDALFELGNRLSMRENFDIALDNAFSARKDCIWIAQNIKRELALCRGDVEGAIIKVLSPVSKIMCDYYIDVYRASVRDIRDAGKLATSIAHQLQDQNGVRKDIENKLKSMLDMMTGTSAIFAPLILGMSIVMLGPISNITGQVFFTDITQTLMIYLIELAALISVLSSNLMCRGKLTDILGRFCLMMPVALIVFTVCSTLTI